MKNTDSQPLFKAWVPEWAIRAVLFWALLPPFLLLGLYAGIGAQVAGYYGVEVADVQFSVLVFYVGLVAFLPFDPRLASYLLTRQYFVVGAFLLLALVGLTTLVHDFRLFLVLRFVQGTVASTILNPLLTLIFSRLHSTRARALGYSVFYGTLLTSGPLGTMLSWAVLDRYDLPALFHAFMLLSLPGVLLLVLILHKVRIKRCLPLIQLEWPSWVLYSGALLSLAYLATYGQQLYWFESGTVWQGLGLLLGCSLAFVVRQQHLKRPYIDLRVFRYRNFSLGLGLFIVFYFFRGTTGIAAAYFTSVLHVDTRQMVLLQAATLASIVLGLSVVARFVLRGTSLRRIWVVGFGLLLVHHVWMCLLFGPVQQLTVFLLPVFLQGLAVGTLMVPLALFTAEALPQSLGPSGSFVAIASRYIAFVVSLGITSVLQLYWRAAQFDRFRIDLLPGTSLVTARVQGLQQTLQSKGLALETAQQGATRLLVRTLEAQTLLRYCLNYYGFVSLIIGTLLVVLLILPSLYRQAATFRQQPL